MYTSGENIEKYITNNNVDMNRTYNSTFFNFVDYRQDNPVRDLTQSQDSQLTTKDGPVVKDGEYVEISHSQSYKTRFLYDTTNNVYLMQQNFSGNWRDTIDEEYNDYQLQFPNVIVLFTDIHTYPGHEAKDLQYVEYSWGGIGYYFYGGKCEKIYWQKGTPLEALRLYYLDENGQCSDTPCEINIGKSYVTIVDVDEAINLKVGNLADFDLDAATVSASNTSIDADAKAGESLGASTTDLVSAANAIVDDTDARYEAFAKAEAYMINNSLAVPCYYDVRWCLTHVNEYTKINAMFGPCNFKYVNWETSEDAYTTAQYEEFAKAFDAAKS